MSSYKEATYVYSPDNHEVYGQDGFGWYTYADTAQKHFPRVKHTARRNPLFVTLEGMSASKLRTACFVSV